MVVRSPRGGTRFCASTVEMAGERMDGGHTISETLQSSIQRRGWKPHLRKLRDGCSEGLAPVMARLKAAPPGAVSWSGLRLSASSRRLPSHRSRGSATLPGGSMGRAALRRGRAGRVFWIVPGESHGFGPDEAGPSRRHGGGRGAWGPCVSCAHGGQGTARPTSGRANTNVLTSRGTWDGARLEAAPPEVGRKSIHKWGGASGGAHLVHKKPAPENRGRLPPSGGWDGAQSFLMKMKRRVAFGSSRSNFISGHSAWFKSSSPTGSKPLSRLPFHSRR